jgi:hypothetical protein
MELDKEMTISGSPSCPMPSGSRSSGEGNLVCTGNIVDVPVYRMQSQKSIGTVLFLQLIMQFSLPKPHCPFSLRNWSTESSIPTQRSGLSPLSFPFRGLPILEQGYPDMSRWPSENDGTFLFSGTLGAYWIRNWNHMLSYEFRVFCWAGKFAWLYGANLATWRGQQNSWGRKSMGDQVDGARDSVLVVLLIDHITLGNFCLLSEFPHLWTKMPNYYRGSMDNTLRFQNKSRRLPIHISRMFQVFQPGLSEACRKISSQTMRKWDGGTDS